MFVPPKAKRAKRKSNLTLSNMSITVSNTGFGALFGGIGTINGKITSRRQDKDTVNSITYYHDEKLGIGCNGTIVFKGKYDERDVAVKRVQPELFKYPHRELFLLRISDSHPNIIRYFCKEQDKNFLYIALELCAGTVQDYVQRKSRIYNVSLITPLEILKQATSGLAHLHSLDIIHRDIKPPNLLLSIPNNRREVQVKISDFGFSRKLLENKMSLSRSSGVIGTEGWMAPEMQNIEGRITSAIDLFSLGCVFYYVLSKGEHPFSEPSERKKNIESGEYTLDKLKCDEFRIEISRTLITKLISYNAEERPPAAEVLVHPLFWDYKIILEFFQDASDRLKIETSDHPMIKALEKEAASVVRGNWLDHIDYVVKDDLLNRMKYRGEIVKSLLRAIRNTRHHYWELSTRVKHSLGSIPDQFTIYWISRFPLLLHHTLLVMQHVKNEPTFKQYYYTPDSNRVEISSPSTSSSAT